MKLLKTQQVEKVTVAGQSPTTEIERIQQTKILKSPNLTTTRTKNTEKARFNSIHAASFETPT
ncbi:hypothetical protein SAMN06265222_11835 [Neorhodopirellula lusitana]|uniref:Uncharacterized protein n=1 Tax=Neorhodopirellula lusitana TaxID=445327 RepID=A0ABY1QNY8_9BACT|nr:hypothetical protein SAMN06265222_11835 [Neorhodopirellula lusitana]